MDRLKKRAEFLAVAKGARSARRGFVLQALSRPDELRGARIGFDELRGARIGFTVTKKVGNAVERNRVRRRLREAVRLEGDLHARAGTDYVVVGRREALALPFGDILADLAGAFRAVHRDRRAEPRASRPESAAGTVPAPTASDDPSPGGSR